MKYLRVYVRVRWTGRNLGRHGCTIPAFAWKGVVNAREILVSDFQKAGIQTYVEYEG
jgi:hypothetical protein